MTDRSTARVGVLTFHRCINHGSYWQARCLVDGLRAGGHQPVILDHHSPRVTLAEWRCALRPTLPTPVPSGDRKPYRAKLDKFCTATSTLPLSERFDLSGPVPDDVPEVVVVGSDEVWNLHHPWYGGAPLFFGEGLGESRLVSYAASVGNYDATARFDDRWADALRGFDAISVRDGHTRDMVASTLGVTPPVVLDPCLQFPPSRQVLQIDDDRAAPSRPFVAVYGHNFTHEFVTGVQRWAQANGLPTVSISYRNDWCDVQWLEAGPLEYAAAIGRSSAVATNFFHGCVFALLTDTPFVCETSPYRQHKVRCLLDDVGANERLVTTASGAATFTEQLGTAPGPAVAARIADLRERSTRYLDAVLS